MENCCSGAAVVRGTPVGVGDGCGAWLGFSVVGILVVNGSRAAVGSGFVGWGLGAVGSGSGGTISVGATPENTFTRRQQKITTVFADHAHNQKVV